MKEVVEKSGSRQLAENGVKATKFCFARADAKAVHLIGDFNDWNPESLPMRPRHNGWWSIQVPLTQGHHHYLFLVDGKAVADPRASAAIQVTHNQKVSTLAVN